MRIGTWNVEYGQVADKNARRLQRIRAMNCDVWVLTETSDALDLGSDYRAISTSERPARPGEQWTTIWSRLPIVERLPVTDASRTVAAMMTTPVGPLVVYGTVLPWQFDKGSDETAAGWSEHHRVIPLQAAEWAHLVKAHPNAALCVAGDFNMNLGGKHHYGTERGREMMRAGLRNASLTCLSDAEHMRVGLLTDPPIDHICLSAHLAANSSVSNVWERTDAEGVHLSDHSGLVVEVRVQP